MKLSKIKTLFLSEASSTLMNFRIFPLFGNLIYSTRMKKIVRKTTGCYPSAPLAQEEQPELLFLGGRFTGARTSFPIRLLFIVPLLLIASCQTGQERAQERFFSILSKDDKKIDVYKGHYKESNSLVSKGPSPSTSLVMSPKLDSPKVASSKEPQIGFASWYGAKHLFKKSFHGKKTANGDSFNTDALTAAHKTLPIPSIARITNLSNNKSTIVMVNDRGPYHKNRIIDVSSKVASLLDFKIKGIAKVKVEPLKKETEELLEKLSLNPKHGSKPKGKIKEPICTVNCFVKLLNMKYGYKID